MASALLSSSSAAVLKQQNLVLSRHGSPNVSFRRINPVVCTATKDDDAAPGSTPASPVEKKLEAASPVTPIQTPPQPKIQPNKPSFKDLFAFSGPIPEAVNGRLAMLGFTTALAVELASGRDLFGQLGNGGTGYFVYAALTFTAASLVPLLEGVSIERASGGIGGIFTSKAERWNGRAAMLGLVALAITEFVKGSPLV